MIPCLNEAPSIRAVLAESLDVLSELQRSQSVSDFEVIVVDDGSSDQSVDIISEFSRVKIRSHRQSRGYGAAIKTGITSAVGDCVAVYDMDQTYPPPALAQMLPSVLRGADFVIGCRSHQSESMPMLRKTGNRLYRWLIKIMYGAGLRDSCSGMWLFKRDAMLPLLSKLPDQLNFTLALSLLVQRYQLQFEEVAIDYRHRGGHSKLNPLTDGIRFLSTIIVFRFKRLNRDW